MPEAHAAAVKYHYYDHDTEQQNLVPPVQNTWYEVFDDEDVRLIWCLVYQTNDESAAKDIEVRWTIDGTVYLGTISLPHNTSYLVYRNQDPSTGGTAGLTLTATAQNAAYFVDKRGQSFKVEVRITAALGTNQTLLCRCVKETLELT